MLVGFFNDFTPALGADFAYQLGDVVHRRGYLLWDIATRGSGQHLHMTDFPSRRILQLSRGLVCILIAKLVSCTMARGAAKALPEELSP